MKTENRNVYLDIAKVILAIIVVFAHTDFLIDVDKLTWYLFKNGLVRITVPVFLMINGYYFYRIQRKKDFKKWLTRIFLLYLIWMLIYFKYWSLQQTHSILESVIFGWHHLWYVSALLFAGIILYFIRNKSNTKLIFIISSVFLIGVLLQYLKLYHTFEDALFYRLINKPYIVRNFFFFGFPFLTSGYLIKKNESYLKGKKILQLTLLSFILLFLESGINFYLNSGTKGIDILLSQFLICPMLFILLSNSSKTLKFNSKTISLYSSAIYFSHTIPFLYIIVHFKIESSIIISLLTLIFTVIISFALILLNRKVKFLL
ncbi:MAG: acyltransferase family protein [Bacteroidetes bacterium]|jgi:fucose 4-O-acetylase-like acetyltransferase|nr:acyltransferase family protein [Bacteroidota bacterium]